MNQLRRKMSITQGIETRVSLSEKKYPLICFSSYSLQSALPEVFTSRNVNNVNNLVFVSQVMISSKLQIYLDHLQ